MPRIYHGIPLRASDVHVQGGGLNELKKWQTQRELNIYIIQLDYIIYYSHRQNKELYILDI